MATTTHNGPQCSLLSDARLETGLLRFSLVLATIGRTVELSRFLAHLDCQSYRNFELIIVDQNPDERLKPIIAPYRNRFAIKHLKSEKGLSRARNVGLRHISGDVVAIPDDDCWYAADILRKVATALLDHPNWDGLTGRCNARSFHRKDGFIDKINVWRRAISFSIFLRTSVVRAVGDFDESLGVGAESGFGSCEETDYLLRALEQKCQIYYRPDLLIGHPDVVDFRPLQQKGYAYGRGFGRTVKKHRYPLWFLGYVLFRSLGGALRAVAERDLPKMHFYCGAFRGRLSGWLA